MDTAKLQTIVHAKSGGKWSLRDSQFIQSLIDSYIIAKFRLITKSIKHLRTGNSCDECLTFPGCVNGNCTIANQCNCHDGWFGAFCDIRE